MNLANLMIWGCSQEPHDEEDLEHKTCLHAKFLWLIMPMQFAINEYPVNKHKNQKQISKEKKTTGPEKQTQISAGKLDHHQSEQQMRLRWLRHTKLLKLSESCELNPMISVEAAHPKQQSRCDLMHAHQ